MAKLLLGGQLRRGRHVEAQMLEAWDRALEQALFAGDMRRLEQLRKVAEEMLEPPTGTMRE